VTYPLDGKDAKPGSQLGLGIANVDSPKGCKANPLPVLQS